MIKLTRGQEVKIITQRQLSEELRRRKEWGFPNCTKIYTECIGRIEPCITCPYKEGYKMPSSIKTLKPEEYSINVKRGILERNNIFVGFSDSEVEEAFNKLSNEQRQLERKKVKVEIQKVVKPIIVHHKIGIADSIRREIKNGNVVIEDIYEKIKNEYQDRDKKYLIMRVITTIDYLKKRGEIQ